MATAKFIIYPGAITAICDKSPELDRLLRQRCLEIIAEAKKIFRIQEKHNNEWRTSETTPPKYLNSFKIRRVRGKLRAGPAYAAANDDPGAIWVEFGAHAGGETPVLKYRPLGRALIVVGGRH